MTLRDRSWIWLAVLAAVGGLALAVGSSGAGERKPRPKFGDYNPDDPTVEMFAAMESGEIEVRYIPADSTKARVLITNKTGKPVNVRLPEAFAAVPVLAQFGGGQQGGGGGGQQGGGQQSGGGGFGGGGFGGGGQQGGGGGGFFNVPSEKVGQIRVQSVCLEHGKDEPRAAIPYKIIPLTQFSSDPAVYALCRLLGEGRCDQRVAQAAAWHLANHMSWDELAAKQIRRLNGVTYPYFSLQEISAAMALANVAVEEGKTNPAAESPGQKTAVAQP